MTIICCNNFIQTSHLLIIDAVIQPSGEKSARSLHESLLVVVSTYFIAKLLPCMQKFKT